MPHEAGAWRRSGRGCEPRPARRGAAQPIFISKAARRAATAVRVGYAAAMVSAFAGSVALISSAHAASGWLLLIVAATTVLAVRAGAQRR
jgi:hypothetical protein